MNFAKSRLDRIFLIQIAVFVVTIVVVSYAMFYRISIRNVEERVVADFRAELALSAQEIDHRANIAMERTAALSSRTMIRVALHSFHYENQSLEVTREYTQPRYEDGTSVYETLLFARRTYADGTEIAVYGDPSIIQPEILPERAVDAEISFFSHNHTYAVVLRNPIIHEGVFLGYDTAAFDLEEVFGRAGARLLENPRVVAEAEETGGAGRFSSSAPIGDTGWVLHADLRKEILNQEFRGIRVSALLLSSVLILSVLVVSYFTILRLTLRLLREQDSVNERLSRAVEEKSFLLKELHHRVKNNLSMISAFIRLQSSQNDTEEMKARDEVLVSRIHAISLVHEKLQHSGDIQNVDIASYLKELYERILASHSKDDIVLTTDMTATIEIPIERAIPLGLVVAELTANSIKHAAGEGTLHISVALHRQDDSILLAYSDDGTPFPEDFDPAGGSSLGLKVIHSLVEKLDGSINYEVSGKKSIRVLIPV